ncbi:hypothetical protein INR49_008868 [Caranx melampygus]|nr:hypothetical protein INR49_008868 [Caranx melampygus]
MIAQVKGHGAQTPTRVLRLMMSSTLLCPSVLPHIPLSRAEPSRVEPSQQLRCPSHSELTLSEPKPPEQLPVSVPCPSNLPRIVGRSFSRSDTFPYITSGTG